jgi:hypothetical protein
MQSDPSKKLVLHTETLRALKVKTGIKAGAPVASNSPRYCGVTH